MARPRQFSLLTLFVMSSGFGLVAAAIGPALIALIETNRLMNDGVNLTDAAIVAGFNMWAFRIQNGWLLLIGLALIAGGLVMHRRRRSPSPNGAT